MTLGVLVPDFTGLSKRELLPLIESQTVRIVINGTGWVTHQSPPPGTPLTENMTIELTLE